MKKVLLSIAGYDPTAGAGACLDLKVFHSFGYHGMGILTCLTAQNTTGVTKVRCPSSRFIWNQYSSLKNDVNFSGIKVGMLGCAENINPIIRILDDNPNISKIIDPVFKSSDGTWLFEKNAIPVYMKKIHKKASLLTPNLEEAELISGIKIENVPAAEKAAQEIFELTQTPCLLKGGHLRRENIDILYDGNQFYTYKNRKLRKKVHGTGCFLSSSLLCYMAKGLPLDRACSLAIQATHKAMKKTVRIGSGQALFSFPLNHL